MSTLGTGNLGNDWNSGWYAVHTRHQHEKNVARALTGKGFEVLLPLYTAVHRWKDRDKQLSLPLFPCYVFLHNLFERWHSILTTPAVHGVLGFGGKRSMIPCSEIEAVRRMAGSPLKTEPHPFLNCGDRVRLRAGRNGRDFAPQEESVEGCRVGGDAAEVSGRGSRRLDGGACGPEARFCASIPVYDCSGSQLK